MDVPTGLDVMRRAREAVLYQKLALISDICVRVDFFEIQRKPALDAETPSG